MDSRRIYWVFLPCLLSKNSKDAYIHSFRSSRVVWLKSNIHYVHIPSSHHISSVCRRHRNLLQQSVPRRRCCKLTVLWVEWMDGLVIENQYKFHFLVSFMVEWNLQFNWFVSELSWIDLAVGIGVAADAASDTRIESDNRARRNVITLWERWGRWEWKESFLYKGCDHVYVCLGILVLESVLENLLFGNGEKAFWKYWTTFP